MRQGNDKQSKRGVAPAHCGRLNQSSSGVRRMLESSSRNSSALYCTGGEASGDC
jgi:hypothetical protein